MLTKVHAQIVREALGAIFSPTAIDALIAANIGLDNLRGQFGHDEYHFDNNAFDAGHAFLAEQRQLTFEALHRGDVPAARTAFGRLTHTAQDFYAHSNYVDLWLVRHPDSVPADIDPADPDLIASPALHSGKLYYPQEALYFLRPLRQFALSILPRDSHAHMNLDSAERGPRFEYAFWAAVKRTVLEFEQVRVGLSAAELSAFTA